MNGIHHPFFDLVFQIITGKIFWIPFIIGLLYLAYLKEGWRMIFVLISFALAIGLADLISVHLFKDVFQRLRPCHNPMIKSLVHTVNGHCGGQFSFVSSHAANSFSLAFFSGLLFYKKFKWVMPAMLCWAALVSYSRIYVGVHFPADIICGGILGGIIALLVFRLSQFFNQKFNLKLNSL